MSIARDAETKIVLDRERTMRLDFNSLCSIEEVTGKSALSAEIFEAPDARTLRALLWSCLKEDDESLTIEQAGRLITPKKLETIIGKISGIVEVAFGSDEDPTEPAKVVPVRRKRAKKA